jgi:hypothetical protein
MTEEQGWLVRILDRMRWRDEDDTQAKERIKAMIEGTGMLNGEGRFTFPVGILAEQARQQQKARE